MRVEAIRRWSMVASLAAAGAATAAIEPLLLALLWPPVGAGLRFSPRPFEFAMIGAVIGGAAGLSLLAHRRLWARALLAPAFAFGLLVLVCFARWGSAGDAVAFAALVCHPACLLAGAHHWLLRRRRMGAINVAPFIYIAVGALAMLPYWKFSWAIPWWSLQTDWWDGPPPTGFFPYALALGVALAVLQYYALAAALRISRGTLLSRRVRASGPASRSPATSSAPPSPPADDSRPSRA